MKERKKDLNYLLKLKNGKICNSFIFAEMKLEMI